MLKNFAVNCDFVSIEMTQWILLIGEYVLCEPIVSICCCHAGISYGLAVLCSIRCSMLHYHIPILVETLLA